MLMLLDEIIADGLGLQKLCEAVVDRGEARILRLGRGGLSPSHRERGSVSLYWDLGAEPQWAPGVTAPGGGQGQSPLKLKAL